MISAAKATVAASHGSPRRARLLRPGQRLSQPEFHRRYDQTPPGERWELIGGVVHVSSPVSIEHAQTVPLLSYLLLEYQSATPGVQLLFVPTLLLGPQSEPEPDLLMRILPEWGGLSTDERTKSGKSYVKGPVELVAEVSFATAEIDLGPKLKDYQKCGVLEYIVLLGERRELRWFELQAGSELRADAKGVVRSRAFPGLWLHREALLDGDTTRLMRTARRGLASAAHERYAARLRSKRQR